MIRVIIATILSLIAVATLAAISSISLTISLQMNILLKNGIKIHMSYGQSKLK